MQLIAPAAVLGDLRTLTGPRSRLDAMWLLLFDRVPASIYNRIILYHHSCFRLSWGTIDLADEKRTHLKNWPEDERPRERLLKQGADKLSDAQLLGIILRTGKGGRTAVAEAKMLDANGLLYAYAVSTCLIFEATKEGTKPRE